MNLEAINHRSSEEASERTTYLVHLAKIEALIWLDARETAIGLAALYSLVPNQEQADLDVDKKVC